MNASTPAPSAKSLSPFGTSALSLDNDFMELERISGQIERLDIQTENGLEKAQQLMKKFAECGQRISTAIPGFAKTLEEARVRAEKAGALVEARAAQVQARTAETNQLNERFQMLSEMVKQISNLLGKIKKPAGQVIPPEEKAFLQQQLPEIDAKLGILIEEAVKLKGEAQSSRMKTLERNADSLSQTMISARRKLSAFVERPTL